MLSLSHYQRDTIMMHQYCFSLKCVLYHLFPTHWLLMTPTVAFNSVRFFLVPQASLLPGTSE